MVGQNFRNDKRQNGGNVAGAKGDNHNSKFSTEPMDSDKMINDLDPNLKTTLRFLINRDSAGRIIGKRGETVKQLREQFDCRVQIPDSGTVERVLSVTGDISQLFDCIEEILSRIQKQDKADKPNGFEIRLLVHQSQAGAVIGNQGIRIKQLRTENNCQVRCFPSVCPESTDRIVRIAGDQKDAIKVLKLCFCLCLSSPPRGPNIEYNSQFYNPAMVTEYGGIGSEIAALRNQGNQMTGNSSMPMYGNDNSFGLNGPAGFNPNSFNQSGQMYPSPSNSYNQQRMPSYPMNNQMSQNGYPGPNQQPPQSQYPPYSQGYSNYSQGASPSSYAQPQAYSNTQQTQQLQPANNMNQNTPQAKSDWSGQPQQPQQPNMTSQYGYLNSNTPSGQNQQQNSYGQPAQSMPSYGASVYQQNQPSPYGQPGMSPYGAPQGSYSDWAQKFDASKNKPLTSVQKAKHQQ